MHNVVAFNVFILQIQTDPEAKSCRYSDRNRMSIEKTMVLKIPRCSIKLYLLETQPHSLTHTHTHIERERETFGSRGSNFLKSGGGGGWY